MKAKIQQDCFAMKLKALEMALSSGSFGSHIGGAFSAMELLATLYNIADLDFKNESRDRIIISKAHCVLALYTALWRLGLISDEELATYDKDGTAFYGHAHRNLSHGIEFSGGSLGLGISYAVGTALACKRKRLNNRIYVLIGDGECDEGIVWEALMAANQFKLNNLCIIVDCNGYQLDGPVGEVMDNGSLSEKFMAFGFETKTIDGHDIECIIEALQSEVSDKPLAIMAKTVKANGISFLENNKMSHQCALSKKKYEQAVKEIREAYGEEI